MNLQDLCHMSLNELAETCKQLRRTQEGTHALEILLNRLDPVILQVGAQLSVPMRDVEDLMQEGRLCAIELVDTYNGVKDGLFESIFREKLKVRLEANKTYATVLQNINMRKRCMENTSHIYPRRERHEIRRIYMGEIPTSQTLESLYENAAFDAVLEVLLNI